MIETINLHKTSTKAINPIKIKCDNCGETIDIVADQNMLHHLKNFHHDFFEKKHYCNKCEKSGSDK